MCSQAERAHEPTAGKETKKGEGRQNEECLYDVPRGNFKNILQEKYYS